MARGGHNKKTADELDAAGTSRPDRLGPADDDALTHLETLLDAWVTVARAAVEEINRASGTPKLVDDTDGEAVETKITIVNAGKQVQPHPRIGVLEKASKRIEALVVLRGRFAGAEEDDEDDDSIDDED